MRSWRLERSETLFQHKIFKLLRHHLAADAPTADEDSRGPSTKQALVLEAPDWVNVIPRLDDGRVVLVRQWRYGIGAPTLEIPGGMIDPGESPAEAAGRELFEETGYRAASLRELGVVEPNPAFLSNRCTTFLASGLESFGPPQGDGDEELEVVIIPLHEIPKRIAEGEIRHAIVIAAFHWLLVRAAAVALVFVATLSAAATPTFTSEITVTATRSPAAFGESGRSILVLTREQIERQPVQSLPELLQLFPAFDARRRGAFGVQADLSVRGASFEDVLVLVDGVPMNNPQTGHHNADLPVALASIERVELLAGPGSALYGANASGGVVQILTRRDTPSGAHAEARIGQHSLAGGSLGADLQRGALRGGIQLERLESAGHRAGAEFDQSTASLRLGSGGLSVTAAADERDFGAYRFYSTRFPDQQERTAGGFAAVRFERPWNSETTLSTRAAFRKHRDHFILDRARPAFSQNFHRDESLDAEATARRAFSFGDVELGLGGRREELRSSNLGRRDRDRLGQFSAVSWRGTRMTLQGALHLSSIDSGAGSEFEADPSIASAFSWGGGRLRLSAARAHRLPSFTELYYNDPATAGNPALEAERSWTYEVGYERATNRHRVSAALFRRDGSNLIDFVRAPGDLLFRAVNLRKVATDGVEVSGAYSIGDIWLRGGYGWLDASGDAPTGTSRYVFDYLEHRALVAADGRLPGRLEWGANLSWNRRRGQEDYTRLDLRLLRQLGRGFAAIVDVSNLGDAGYIEQGAVEMPGRWVVATIRWRSLDSR